MRCRTSYWRPHMILVICIGVGWTALMLFEGPPVNNPSQNISWLCVTASGPALVVTVIIILTKDKKKMLRTYLSSAYITREGVRNVCICLPDVSLRWEECKEIGIAEVHVRWGHKKAFYFSRSLVSKKQTGNVLKTPISADFIWVQYNKVLHNKLMEYIPLEHVKNYELLSKR